MLFYAFIVACAFIVAAELAEPSRWWRDFRDRMRNFMKETEIHFSGDSNAQEKFDKVIEEAGTCPITWLDVWEINDGERGVSEFHAEYYAYCLVLHNKRLKSINTKDVLYSKFMDWSLAYDICEFKLLKARDRSFAVLSVGLSPTGLEKSNIDADTIEYIYNSTLGRALEA